MKRIFTFLSVLFAALMTTTATYAADAETQETVVGTDNYTPTGSSFDWPFTIDFATQKLTATVDLSTCQAEGTNENVASIGTDIDAYFSNKQNAGNIHFYYTPSTKTLSCQYISSNASYGAWKYITPKTDIEGEISIDLSKQYGLRLNGEQIFNPAQLQKLLTQTDLHFGSLEGSNRSYATYKKVRIEAAAFEPVEPITATGLAKLKYEGKYTRYDAATVSYQPTAYNSGTLTLKQLSIGGKVLGDIIVADAPCSYIESSGNDSPGFVLIKLSDGKGTLANIGAKATELSLTEGQEIDVPSVYLYFYGEYLYGTTEFKIGDETLTYTHGVSEPSQSTFTSTLATDFSGEKGEYESKTFVVNDYGDGFADLTFKDLQFKSLSDQNIGDLVIKEVPYVSNGSGEHEFSCAGYDAALENSPSEMMKNFSGVNVSGKVSGAEAYFTVDAQVLSGMDVNIVFGEPIAAFTVYTDKQSVYYGSAADDYESATLSVRPSGEGKYTICLTNVEEEQYVTFTAEGTTDADGVTTYTAEKAVAPLLSDTWTGYDAYVTIDEAKSYNGQFYGVFTVDFGGYGEMGYSDYYHTVVFGEDFTPTAINAMKAQLSGKTVQIFTTSGTRVNALQKGINIVRTENGMTMKIVKK